MSAAIRRSYSETYLVNKLGVEQNKQQIRSMSVLGWNPTIPPRLL
jgi:hypothetical protein